jgi:hypothetical protein
MISSRAAVVVILAAGLATACAPARPRPTAAVQAACRAETDRVYAAQNRAELSYRDQRDTPFAGSYNSGITSRGLGSLFGRDRMESACLQQNTPGATTPPPVQSPGTGPTFQQ